MVRCWWQGGGAGGRAGREGGGKLRKASRDEGRGIREGSAWWRQSLWMVAVRLRCAVLRGAFTGWSSMSALPAVA